MKQSDPACAMHIVQRGLLLDFSIGMSVRSVWLVSIVFLDFVDLMLICQLWNETIMAGLSRSRTNI